MKFAGRFLAASAVAVIMGSLSFAGQTPVRFKVPFAFEIGGTKLPAGEYQVVENSAQTLRITGLDSKKQVLVSDKAGSSFSREAGDPQIVFRQYGDHYFLHQIYEGQTQRIREFPDSKTEKAVRTALREEPKVIVLAAR